MGLTKEKKDIKEEIVKILCFWLHKRTRWSEDPASGKLWDAISDLGNGEWASIVEDALNEAWPTIKKYFKK